MLANKFTVIVLLATSSSTLWAQLPFIPPHKVVNAASYIAPGLPGGAIARGSIFSIFGRNLGPASSPPLSFPLATTLGGVSIKVFQGATTVNAYPIYVSATQINAVMPSNAPLGLVSVRVTYNNAASNPSPVRIVNDSVGIFAVNSAGIGPGVFWNFVAQNDQPVNSFQAAAKPGQVITAWATGLGPVSYADNIAPTAGNLPTPVEVYVGGQAAQVSYSGRSPCCAGVDQIVFTVPANAPLGCWVPVLMRTSGTTVGNVTSMAISADGSPCSDAHNPLSAAYIKGGNIGLLTFLRASIHEDNITFKPVDVTTDTYLANTTQEKGGPAVFDPFLSEPPAGSCSVITSAGDYFAGDPLAGPRTSVKTLDYGAPLQLTGPRGTITLPEFYTGSGSGAFGSSVSLYYPTSRLYLDPGNYTVSGSGGPDIAKFQAAFTIPTAFNWTNRDQAAVVARSQPLTLTWSGAPAGQTLAIFGANVDVPANSTAIFYCIVPPGATSFTIPAPVLSVLPATRLDPLQSKGAIYLSNIPIGNGTPFAASGLDAAVARGVLWIGRNVIFQ